MFTLSLRKKHAEASIKSSNAVAQGGIKKIAPKQLQGAVIFC